MAEEAREEKPKKAGKKNPSGNNPNKKSNDQKPNLQPPEPIEVRKNEWEQYGFNETERGEMEAIKVKRADDSYDFYINMDNKFLRAELENKKNDPEMIKQQYKWGLTISTIGVIVEEKDRSGDSENGVDLESVERHCNGVARVLLPMIRTMGELDLANLT